MHIFNLSKNGLKSFPCRICGKSVKNNTNYVSCSFCNHRIHNKCNKISFNSENRNLELCNLCQHENLPFSVFNSVDDSSFKGHDSPLLRNLKNLFNSSHFFESGEISHDSTPEDIGPLVNCKDFDINDFNFSSNKNHLSVFHQNIVTLEGHKDELENVLAQINFSFDVIGLTETRIKKDILPNYSLNLPDYKHFYTPTEMECGGTILYVKKNLTCKPRMDLEKILYKKRELESSFVEIKFQKNKSIICGCIYKHPSMDIKEFNENYLDSVFKIISKEKKSVFFMGDFNINLLNINTDNNVTEFFDIMASNSLIPFIIHPTRVTPFTNTIIDNIFSDSHNHKDSYSGNIRTHLTDHFAQYLLMPLERKNNKFYNDKFIRDTKNLNSNNYINDLQSIDWINELELEKADINKSFFLLEEKINKIVNQYFPLKKVSNKKNNLKIKPWMTKQIMDEIKKRDKAYKKFAKEKDLDKKTELFNNFKHIRNRIVTMCRASKKNHYKTYFQNNSGNIRKTWQGIKSVVNINQKSNSSPDTISVNDEVIKDPKTVANSFNSYFSSIASKLQAKIHPPKENFSKYLKNRVNNDFLLNPTNYNEVMSIIENINPSKATGPHSIPPFLLSKIYAYICHPIADLINMSFKQGIYIDALKVSKTIPIFKDKGSELDVQNYRPISLLSNINKIFEKIMFKRVVDFLNKNKCLYKKQFGFRQKHSTVHALLDLTEEIRMALDRNEFAAGIFLDFSRAFDTVDHQILLQKLDHYGIRGVANKWFKSYLKNRSQFVSINGVSSETILMLLGVPQGSILGPLLFLIYINDFYQAVFYSTTRHFADDTNLLLSNKSIKKIQKQINIDLKLISKWLRANKISLNAGKSELIIFRHPMKTFDYNLKIKINGKRLFESNSVKYLGIFIDSHLKWNYHVDSIAPKLSRAVGMLSKLRHFVNRNTLRSIYYAVFSSIMSYGSIIWGQAQNKYIDRICGLQDKAIRTISFASFNDSRKPLYKNLKILRFKDQLQVQNFLLAHDFYNKNLPDSFDKLFRLAINVHDHNTRFALSMHFSLPKVRTSHHGIKSITYQSVSAWNRFINIFQSSSLYDQSKSSCKKMISSFILNSY